MLQLINKLEIKLKLHIHDLVIKFLHNLFSLDSETYSVLNCLFRTIFYMPTWSQMKYNMFIFKLRQINQIVMKVMRSFILTLFKNIPPTITLYI